MVKLQGFIGEENRTMHQFDDMFSGTWISWNWAPTKDDSGTELSTNQMTAHQIGHQIIFESTPNEEESYMLIRLTIVDENLVSGEWHQTTSPAGEFNGKMYSGAGQLIISDNNYRFTGEWAGLGFDHIEQKQRIYTGHWELARVVDGIQPKPRHKPSFLKPAFLP